MRFSPLKSSLLELLGPPVEIFFVTLGLGYAFIVNALDISLRRANFLISSLSTLIKGSMFGKKEIPRC